MINKNKKYMYAVCVHTHARTHARMHARTHTNIHKK